MEKKITKRFVLNHIIENYGKDTLVVDYARHELELLDKKANSKTPTKTQLENENLKEVIVKVLTNGATPMTITDIQSVNQELENLSNQKISALLTQLVKDKVVVRTTDKKRAFFSIAD